LVIWKAGFSKDFPETVNDKYVWIADSFNADSPQNYDFSLEDENYINTSLKIQFSKKSYVEFWVDIGEELGAGIAQSI
jgi:hypothetical protein